MDSARGIEGADAARHRSTPRPSAEQACTPSTKTTSRWRHCESLLDPITALTDTVREAVGNDVKTVILFGSIARGEANIHSDVDLAVMAPAGWDGRTDLEDAVRIRLGNNCDVLVFTPEDFTHLADIGEPVVREILTGGVALIGSIPRMKSRVA